MLDIKRAFDRARSASEERQFIKGRLGMLNADGTVTVIVPDRPGYLYVRLGAEGEFGVSIAKNTGIPKRAHLPILLRRENGELVIRGIDYSGGRLEAFLDGNDGALSDVPYHTHVVGSGLEYQLEALRMEQGRVKWVSGLTVYVNPFRYWTGSAWQTWEGGSIDLTSYKPGTAGTWAWVLVGVTLATNTLVAVAGTAQSTALALTIAQLDDISWTTDIPCGAVRVKADDTTLNRIERYADAHGWFNQFTLSELNDLSDVTLTSLVNGQLLQYNSATGQWVNATWLLVTSLNDLTDVIIATPAANHVLRYDSGSSQWLNVANPYVYHDGTIALSADWDIGEDRRIQAEALRARDAEGLRLEDDAGNLGLMIEDGGQVGVNVAAPLGRFQSSDANGHVLHWSHSTVGSPGVVIIPGGTDDVASAISFLYVIRSAGDIGHGSGSAEISGSHAVVLTDGTWTFAVSAGGEFTVERTAGSGTAAVTIWGLWR